MPDLELVDLGDRQAADDCGLAVADEELVVGALLPEDESDVRRRELRIRILGVQLEQDLAVVGDVRRDASG